MKIIILTCLFTLSSCSLLSSKKDDAADERRYVKYAKKDYLDHYRSIDEAFQSNVEKDIYKIKNSSKAYIAKTIKQIKENNELFFKKGIKNKVRFIKTNKPVHFSFPDGTIYLSTGLVKKYMKHEFILMCVLTYELIRSENNIYRKIILIPTKNIDLNKVLSINKVNADTKIEIHKWAYHLLKRTGVDPEMYLSWLQIQNRNSLDFYSMLIDVSEITLEEFAFKNYLITNKSDELVNIRKTDKNFYGFLRSFGESQ